MGAGVTVWYGAAAAWWAPLERDARRRCGPALRHRYGYDYGEGHRLVYLLSGLDVVGDPDPVDVTITFYANPPYPTYGLPPQDSPRVHAKVNATSKHRYPDGALCLWYPLDPPDRRWTSDKGLLDLIEITRRHLFLENYWRATGGHHGGEWLIEDAPHGFGKAG
ncbi:MAG: hypothetical protein GEV03_19090 [Streptosporangiales bacterium]|nr:hypothetical protein [Streptosporangiales bacterium]